MNFAYIIYLDMRIIELMIWRRGASGYNVQSKNFHVEAKPMLEDDKIMFCIEPAGLTTTMTGLTIIETGQTATRRDQTTALAGQTVTQAGPTARTQGQRLFDPGTETC
jgi:hypothetical protein